MTTTEHTDADDRTVTKQQVWTVLTPVIVLAAYALSVVLGLFLGARILPSVGGVLELFVTGIVLGAPPTVLHYGLRRVS